MGRLNINQELKWIGDRLLQGYEQFGKLMPSECSTNQMYAGATNTSWTNGFWVGMMWLMYENTNDTKFYKIATELTDEMITRLESDINLDHHDIGFLYSLSVVAAYNNTNDQRYLRSIEMASDKLISRFQEKGQFIQCWGQLGDHKEHRLIVDSLLNLPLLYKSSILLNDDKYKSIANKHYMSVYNNIIRENWTTYHTYYFDPTSGAPSHGVTRQGNRDDSCWARGQAWAITGFAFNYEYVKSFDNTMFEKLLDVFIDNIPKDGVVYWDFDFNDNNPSAKDSSANSIVACGLLEYSKYVDYDTAIKLNDIAYELIQAIHDNYTNKNTAVNSLVTGATYSFHENFGVNEACLWGDYFYLEALTRLKSSNFKKYW